MVFSRYKVFFVSVLFFQNTCAAEQAAVGPQCFNYEAFEHAGHIGANNALTDYAYPRVYARHQVMEQQQRWLQISKKRGAGQWLDTLVPLIGGLLNIQEACLLILERRLIEEITVVFRHPTVINDIAAGVPLNTIAINFQQGAGFPGGVQRLTQYVHNALLGGGYTPNTLSALLYRLRHNLLGLNYTNVNGQNATEVLIHIRSLKRRSKNTKELSYNSLNRDIQGANNNYNSIKNLIDTQYELLGIEIPHSATILSSRYLQVDVAP